MNLGLVRHQIIRCVVRCESNLHIGMGRGDIEIGGVDSPIIRHPYTDLPYIPGSSMKGKLRSLLEHKYRGEQISSGSPCGCARPWHECKVCTIFGPHMNPKHQLGPTRILVRDALPTEATIRQLETLAENKNLPLAGIKAEVVIDRARHTAAAAGPRYVEFVHSGAEFTLEISLRVFEDDRQRENEMVELVREGLRLLEDDYLGGYGSRGYGKVKIIFHDVPPAN